MALSVSEFLHKRLIAYLLYLTIHKSHAQAPKDKDPSRDIQAARDIYLCSAMDKTFELIAKKVSLFEAVCI